MKILNFGDEMNEINVLVKDLIYSSIINLFENQSDIFENTEQTNLTEWNLSYHLANEIKKYIFWLDSDLDVTKRNYQNRRPDIIFHKRQVNTFNFLVVELKKSKHDNQTDIAKITEDWMKKPLYYRFGVYINIWGRNKYKAVLFEGDGSNHVIDRTCTYINIPKNDENLMIASYINENKYIKKETLSLLSSVDKKILRVYKREGKNMLKS